MRRRIATGLITAAGILALASCGTAAAQPHAQPAVTRTVTASPAPAPCASRIRLSDPDLTQDQVTALCNGAPLPVVTRTADVSVPGPAGVPCYVDPGAAYPVLQPAGTGPWTQLACSVVITDVTPQYLAEEDLTISASGYGSETYLVTVP